MIKTITEDCPFCGRKMTIDLDIERDGPETVSRRFANIAARKFVSVMNADNITALISAIMILLSTAAGRTERRFKPP